MRSELYEYLKRFMAEYDWIDENISKQARAIFTTICLTENIDADTKYCDDILSELYGLVAMEELLEYEDFTKFMLELIV